MIEWPNVDNIFLILFLLSPFVLLFGLIKPGAYSKLFKRTLSRKKIAGLSLVWAMAAFLGFAVTMEPSIPKDTGAALEEVILDESSRLDKDNSQTVEASPTKRVEKTPTKKQTQLIKVIRVIDGDTVEIEGGERVRYIGIDTPETGDCYSTEATNKNSSLVSGKMVRLEKDVSETGRYGRLLRYIWVEDELINETLVREGYAQSSTYPPDVKYQNRFVAAQKLAVSGNLGLWGAVCDTVQVTQPTSGGSTGSCMYSCSGPDRDCADFQTHAQAVAFFSCCGFTVNNDPMRLDSVGVGDGDPCESLP